MPVPVQPDVRTFEQGLVESISEFARTASFNSAQEVWLIPGYEGVLGEYGPYTQKENLQDTGEKVVNAITAKDSSGNVLRVVHDLGNGTVRTLNANGTLGSAISGAPTSLAGIVDFTVYADKILCFNGSATPFQISISAGTATSIGLTQPSVTNASAAIVGGSPAGNVKGTVKYYIAQITGTAPNITEGALSVSFGQVDAASVNDGEGTQVSIDLTHADFGSNTYRLYRTYANREAPNFLATVVGGNSYTDNIVDDELGDLPRLHGDPPPAAITATAVYNDVVYGIADNLLYYSDPGEEESWWTATDGNSISLDRGDGDVATALFVEPDGVVIFKRHHILKLLGGGPEDYRLIPVTPTDQSVPTVGTENINTICGIPGGAFFYYEGGFYVYSQGQVQRVSEAIDRLFHAASVHGTGSSGVVRYDPRFGIVHCGFSLTVTKPSTVEATTLAFHVPTRRWLGMGKVVTAYTSFAITAMMYDPEQGEFSQFEHDPGGLVQHHWHYWVAPDQDLALPSDSDLLSTGDAQLVLPRFYGRTEFNEKRFLWAEVEALGTATGDGTLKLEYAINGAAYATAGTATLGSTRAKYRFNIGEYGREMDVRMTMDEGFRIFRVVVGFQEFGSKSV